MTTLTIHAMTRDPREVIRDALEVTRKAQRLQSQVDTINARRRAIIAELLKGGMQQAEVARLLDVSRQRITQYAEELREAGELEQDEQPPAE